MTASAIIAPESGLQVQASTHYTSSSAFVVELTYGVLRGGPVPARGEDFVVSVLVQDAGGAVVDSTTGGVVIL